MLTANWRLVVSGAGEGPGEAELGIPVSYRGAVESETDLPALYQAADAYVLPSLQDNLPNTVVESLACGTPVVAFRSGGLADMIENGVTGRLADPFSPASLASAIKDTIEAAEKNSWRAACRREFERMYAWPGPAYKYLDLYQDMLQRTPDPVAHLTAG
jgi:glycosyltransferase involved in cell wall biosynthesis